MATIALQQAIQGLLGAGTAGAAAGAPSATPSDIQRVIDGLFPRDYSAEIIRPGTPEYEEYFPSPEDKAIASTLYDAIGGLTQKEKELLAKGPDALSEIVQNKYSSETDQDTASTILQSLGYGVDFGEDNQGFRVGTVTPPAPTSVAGFPNQVTIPQGSVESQGYDRYVNEGIYTRSTPDAQGNVTYTVNPDAARANAGALLEAQDRTTPRQPVAGVGPTDVIGTPEGPGQLAAAEADARRVEALPSYAGEGSIYGDILPTVGADPQAVTPTQVVPNIDLAAQERANQARIDALPSYAGEGSIYGDIAPQVGADPRRITPTQIEPNIDLAAREAANQQRIDALPSYAGEGSVYGDILPTIGAEPQQVTPTQVVPNVDLAAQEQAYLDTLPAFGDPGVTRDTGLDYGVPPGASPSSVYGTGGEGLGTVQDINVPTLPNLASAREGAIDYEPTVQSTRYSDILASIESAQTLEELNNIIASAGGVGDADPAVLDAYFNALDKYIPANDQQTEAGAFLADYVATAEAAATPGISTAPILERGLFSPADLGFSGKTLAEVPPPPQGTSLPPAYDEVEAQAAEEEQQKLEKAEIKMVDNAGITEELIEYDVNTGTENLGSTIDFSDFEAVQGRLQGMLDNITAQETPEGAEQAAISYINEQPENEGNFWKLFFHYLGKGHGLLTAAGAALTTGEAEGALNPLKFDKPKAFTVTLSDGSTQEISGQAAYNKDGTFYGVKALNGKFINPQTIDQDDLVGQASGITGTPQRVSVKLSDGTRQDAIQTFDTNGNVTYRDLTGQALDTAQITDVAQDTGGIAGQTKPTNIRYLDNGNERILPGYYDQINRRYVVVDGNEEIPLTEFSQREGITEARAVSKSFKPAIQFSAGGIPGAVTYDESTGIPTFDLNESQGKAFSYGFKAIPAEKRLSELEGDIGYDKVAGLYEQLQLWASRNATKEITPAVLNSIIGDVGLQQYGANLGTYLQAILRSETGAAYTGSEFLDYASRVGISAGMRADAVPELQRLRKQALASIPSRAGAAAGGYLIGLMSGDIESPNWDAINSLGDPLTKEFYEGKSSVTIHNRAYTGVKKIVNNGNTYYVGIGPDGNPTELWSDE